MKKRIGALLILIAVGLLFWALFARRQPTTLVLPDGSTVRVAAVTYGTNHVVHSRLSAFTANLPIPWQTLLRKKFARRVMPMASMRSTSPQFIVWLERPAKGPSSASPPVFGWTVGLGNGSNFISGTVEGVNTYTISYQGVQLLGLDFPVFPRRDRQIFLNLFRFDPDNAAHLHGTLSFANPQFQAYPTWPPEPLPATRRVGNLEITLSAFETGFGNPNPNPNRDASAITFSTSRNVHNYSAAKLRVQLIAATNEAWDVSSVQLSDATGNVATTPYFSANGNDVGFSIMPSLWPDEAAWKVKFSLAKTKGLAPDELIVFKNVPLGGLNQANALGWTTNANGVTLTLDSLFRRPPVTNNAYTPIQLSEVKVSHSPLPEGTLLDLVGAAYDDGSTNQSMSLFSSGNNRSYLFREFPSQAKTADFTFTIKKPLTVEFTVKPEMPNILASKKK